MAATTPIASERPLAATYCLEDVTDSTVVLTDGELSNASIYTPDDSTTQSAFSQDGAGDDGASDDASTVVDMVEQQSLKEQLADERAKNEKLDYS